MHYVHNLNTSMSPHQQYIGGFPNTVSVLKTGAQRSNPCDEYLTQSAKVFGDAIEIALQRQLTLYHTTY